MQMIEASIQGVTLRLTTAPGLFSPEKADAGTLAMLAFVNLNQDDIVLDLGCGYGLAGIWAAKQIGGERVTLCDINPAAVALAKENAAENGVAGVSALVSDALAAVERHDYTLILCNPPYHEDFSVPKLMIEQGFAHLAMGGRMMMVTKRRLWYENKLRAVFGGVTVQEKDGYFIFKAQKRLPAPRPKQKKTGGLSRKLQRKYAPKGD